MESNNPFFFAINASAAAAASAANYYFPSHPQQFFESPRLGEPPPPPPPPPPPRSNNRSARRKRKSSHGVRRTRTSAVKDEEEEGKNNDDNEDDEEDDDEEEEERETNPLSPNNNNKLTQQDSNPKRCRTGGGSEREKTAAISSSEEANKDSSNEKEKESRQQDYIHVRARRGQATDSHSLAERVRREKISERMKLLQNLVPGCNKVMGKALMLDEIINYVQSLQRQVEFLSMKLAAVNPLDFRVNSLLLRPKDTNRAGQQPQQLPDLLRIHRAENSSAAGSSYSQRINGAPPLESFAADGTENKLLLDELDNPSFCSSISMEFPFADASQLGNFWEDDLQSVVQMGFFGAESRRANLLAELLRPCDDGRQQED